LSKEKQLAAECYKRKEQAQKKVYELYAPILRGVCYRYASNEAEGEDILQESFVKIFTRIDKFTWDGENSFLKWMRRVTVNTAIDTYNKNKKIQYVDIDTVDHLQNFSDDTPYNIIVNEEMNEEELIEALNKVTECYRVVFNLFVIEGYSHKEIADILKIDEQTSRSRMRRAKNQLKTIIGQLCKDTMKSVV